MAGGRDNDASGAGIAMFVGGRDNDVPVNGKKRKAATPRAKKAKPTPADVKAAKLAERRAKRAAREKKYRAVILRWTKAGAIPYPPLEEHLFHAKRLWRFDYAWPEYKLAIEVQGGGPRHHHANRKGVENDYAKTCTAQIMGWRVFPMTPRQFAGAMGQSVVVALFANRHPAKVRV